MYLQYPGYGEVSDVFAWLKLKSHAIQTRSRSCVTRIVTFANTNWVHSQIFLSVNRLFKLMVTSTSRHASLKAYDMLVCRILQNCKTVITDRLKKSTYNFIRDHHYFVEGNGTVTSFCLYWGKIYEKNS